MTLPSRGTPAPPLPLDAATMERWGIRYDAAQGVLHLAPQVRPEAPVTHCPPFRAGRTVVVLEARLRPSTVQLRIEVTFGPPIRIEATLPGDRAEGPIFVDDVALPGPRVAFEARTAHEVAWPVA